MGKRKKPAPKNGRTTAVAKVEQPHGGALNSGGTPGNAGGLGNLPSLVRERCRGSFEQRIPILEQIADGLIKQELPAKFGVVEVLASPRDRIHAIDVLGKYGGIEKLTVETDTPPQHAESGEAVMNRILQMIGRALLAAPVAQRLAVISELERVEVVSG